MRTFTKLGWTIFGALLAFVLSVAWVVHAVLESIGGRR